MRVATIYIDEHVTLPDFPSDPSEVEWKSRRGLLDTSMGPYKITADGRLLRKDVERVRTDEVDTIELGSDSVSIPRFKTLNENWVIHPQHGSFEFHTTVGGTWYGYEARFTHSSLDEIIPLDTKNRRNPANEKHKQF